MQFKCQYWTKRFFKRVEFLIGYIKAANYCSKNNYIR
jgi:hypothetical protein